LDGSQEGNEAGQSLAGVDCPEREFFRQESDERVRRALEYLQPEQRIVVELKFFQELTFEQIAFVVEAPLSTVKSRLYHGLEILKVRLGRNAARNSAGGWQ
jgi:RNA polymerase sigma-70 factor (ECF subfamily)